MKVLISFFMISILFSTLSFASVCEEKILDAIQTADLSSFSNSSFEGLTFIPMNKFFTKEETRIIYMTLASRPKLEFQNSTKIKKGAFIQSIPFLRNSDKLDLFNIFPPQISIKLLEVQEALNTKLREQFKNIQLIPSQAYINSGGLIPLPHEHEKWSLSILKSESGEKSVFPDHQKELETMGNWDTVIFNDQLHGSPKNLNNRVFIALSWIDASKAPKWVLKYFSESP